jgi:hypothetical protein
MIRHIVLFAAFLLLSGCVLPEKSMPPNGVLAIKVISPGKFQVGDSVYSESDLGYALERLNDSPKLKTLEVLIPSPLLNKDKGASCAKLAMVASRAYNKELLFFEWMPNDESTKKVISCNIVVVG